MTGATFLEEVGQPDVPEHIRGDRLKNSRLVVVKIPGESLGRIIESRMDPSLTFVDCNNGSHLATSFGPFYNGEFLGPSIKVPYLEEKRVYELIGTIPRDLATTPGEVCIEVSAANLLGARLVSNRVPVSIPVK